MPEHSETIPREIGVFRLGEWLVEPSLNRISRGEEKVQLELKAMDVLLCLADRCGELVRKRELVDAVWQTEFVSDNTLTRRIADLRQALGDDARDPRYIETIPRRGYRLVAELESAEHRATVTPFPAPAPGREAGPYPGLAAFTEADSELFFGREREVATLWRKITSRRLLAVIGPSGVGKSSFLRAGVIPAGPEGWGTVVLKPGEAPLASLALALAPGFVGDLDGVKQLLGSGDPDVALAMVSRWRDRWQQALLVVDQLEELFTLNPPAVQASFSELLFRLATAADVHVVLVLRDDFLYECHAQQALAPILKDLTLLGPPAEADLRRAVVEPALRCGHRFSDEMLAEEMVAEVADERGALPLLAFAVARLWELRDQGRSLLHREAYERMGGVGGALVQHAEATLDEIGAEGRPIVRELFRNLVTAKGTRAVRAVRAVHELLSVFDPDQREAAAGVLQALVDARLLTVFETETGHGTGEPGRRRVEIVHESLLQSWPRLVRWQTQDADAAQLRDQLRQAARLWQERSRPRDLLWTGSSYRELELWLEIYPGGLTATEQAFAQAAKEYAGRRRRRRRAAVAAAVLLLAGVTAVVTALWQKSEHFARRAEARQLFHLGQLEVDRTPGGALARALASLELEDAAEVRHLALRALWKGPMGLSARKETGRLELGSVSRFSPDGRWLVAGYWSGEVALWSASGGKPTVWQAHQTPALVWFAPDSSAVLSVGWQEPTYRFWSVPGGQLLCEEPITALKPPVHGDWMTAAGNMIHVLRVLPTSGVDAGGPRVDPRSEEILSWLNSRKPTPAVLDPTGELLAYADGGYLFVKAVDAGTDRPPQLVARNDRTIQQIAFSPALTQVGTVDNGGGVQLWSLDAENPEPLRRWQGDTAERCTALAFDPSGSYLVSGHADGLARVWGVDDPPDADPMRFVVDLGGVSGLAFHPGGRWLANVGPGGVGIRPLDRARYGHVLLGHAGSVDDLAFSPDGSWLVSASSDGEVRLWSLTPDGGECGRVLVDWGAGASFTGLSKVAVSPDGTFVVAAIGGSSVVRVVSMGGDVRAELPLPVGDVHALAVGREGRRIAVGLITSGTDNRDGSGGLHPVLIVWEHETGETTVVDDVPRGQTFQGLDFAEDGAVLAACFGGLHRWDPVTMDHELLLENLFTFALCRSDEVLLGAYPDAGEMKAIVHDLATGRARELVTHGGLRGALNISSVMAMDQACKVIVTVRDKDIRVGPVTGEAPHLLLGHEDYVNAVAVSPDGRWIASASCDKTIRLWSVPDLTRTPLHVLPREELLDRLRRMTSARRVRDGSAPGSYMYERAPFAGWEKVPEW